MQHPQSSPTFSSACSTLPGFCIKGRIHILPQRPGATCGKGRDLWQVAGLPGLAGEKETGGFGSYQDLFHGHWGGSPHSTPSHEEISFIPHPLYSHLLWPAHSQPPRAQKKKKKLLFTPEEGIEAYSSSRPCMACFTRQRTGQHHLVMSAHQSHFPTWPFYLTPAPIPACPLRANGEWEAASQPSGCCSPSPPNRYVKKCLWSPSYRSNKPQLSKAIYTSLQRETNQDASSDLRTVSCGSLAESLPF